MRSARYHVIFDLEQASVAIDDPAALEAFVKECVAAVDMKILAGPVTCAGVPENPGWSSFAVLDFSHISVHTFTAHGEACVDVFSCKPFSIEDARRVCLEHFATPKTQVREKVVWWGTDET